MKQDVEARMISQVVRQITALEKDLAALNPNARTRVLARFMEEAKALNDRQEKKA